MLLAQLLHLRPMARRVVVLVDFVGREVADVDVGGEPRFKGGADVAELFEDDALEEGVGADFGAAGCAVRCSETLRWVAEEAVDGC